MLHFIRDFLVSVFILQFHISEPRSKGFRRPSEQEKWPGLKSKRSSPTVF